MKHLRPLALLAIALLLIETVCIILAPETTLEDGETQFKYYVTLQMISLTGSFIAFFSGLFSLIVFILKAQIKENILGLLLTTAAFMLPIMAYYL